MSLDGFIAGENDDLNWLQAEDDYGYANFYSTIEITLMGYKTYEIVKSFGEFPYPDKTNFVFTSKKTVVQDPHVTFIKNDIVEFARKQKVKSSGDIWLVGGGVINNILLEANLIDRFILFTFPIFLGKGIPLFNGKHRQTQLVLQDIRKHSSGVLESHYKSTH